MTELLQTAGVWLPGSIAMLCLISCSAFFSGSETALFYLTHDQLRSFRSGTRRQRGVAALMATPDRLLTAVLFWNLVINLLYFSISVIVAQRLANRGLRIAAVGYAVAGLITMILFGEVFPKSIAVVFRNRLAPLVATPISVAIRLLDPILPSLNRIARAVRRAIWPNLLPEPVLRAEDLEVAIDAAARHEPEDSRHNVFVAERHVLHNILDLSEITVEELMRPRGMYSTVREPDGDPVRPAGDAEHIFVTGGHSDEVIGVISANQPGASAARVSDIIYVPWCTTSAIALQTIREAFVDAAAVVNEYGETIGVVTSDDLLDAAILPEQSRARRILDREPILEISPGQFEVEGMTTLRYLNAHLGLDHDPALDAALTVAGLVHEQLEAIPEPGKQCVWKGWRLTVLKPSSHGHIRVSLRPDSAKDE